MIRIYKNVKNLNWKYALGETVLIFLGITLAIWFNNWNTGRLDDNKADQYLADLKEDLQSDVEEYSLLLQANSERIRQINLLNQVVVNQNHEKECDSIQKYLASTALIQIFIGSGTVFQDLEGTGNLLLIKDVDLRRRIMKYYAKIESQKKYETLNSEFHINSIGGFLKKEWNTDGMFRIGLKDTGLNNSFRAGDCAKTISGFTRIQKDADLQQQIVNHASFSYFIMKINMEEYEAMRNEATELIQIIEAGSRF